MKNALFHLFIVSWRSPRNTINRPENRVKFQRRSFLFIGLIALCLLFWVEIVEGAAKPQHVSKDYKDYNIIMIWIDALRADHLSCYGYDRKTSPNIDRLARESIVFENNFTPNTVTIASFMSIITSLYPASHGVLYVAKDKLSPRIKTLAQILEMYGYRTAWFGPERCPHLDPKIGFGRGFDTVGIFPKNLNRGRTILFDSIENNKNKKFFLNFHTYKVHDPYMPSVKYKNKFTKQKMKEVIESYDKLEKATVDAIKDGVLQKKGLAWKILGEELASELISRKVFKGDYASSRDNIIFFLHYKKKEYKWDDIRVQVYMSRINCDDISVMKHLEALYDATILEFDTEIVGPLITYLKELNLYDKTIIIICADHGDEFGEHGKLGHGETLYDEGIHVPLIIKVPWVKKGRRIQELTQTVDIMPTILDLLGIPIPYYAQGKSLLPLIKEKNTSPFREYVFGYLSPVELTIRSKEWKFTVCWDGTKELFHLQSDPGEQRNIYLEKRDIASRLESELRKWEASLSSYGEESSFLPHIDKATQEKIKKTGYW